MERICAMTSLGWGWGADSAPKTPQLPGKWNIFDQKYRKFNKLSKSFLISFLSKKKMAGDSIHSGDYYDVSVVFCI